MSNYTAGYIRIRRVPKHIVNQMDDIAVRCDNPIRYVLKPHIQNMVAKYKDIISKNAPPKNDDKKDVTLTGYSQKTIQDLEMIADHIGVSVSDLIKVELFLIPDRYPKNT